MAVEVTLATPGDVPALCELLAILFAQETEFQTNYEKQQTALAEIISQPQQGCIVVARCNQSVVGMVSLLYTVSTALGGRVALLEDMVMHPSCRGSGIGSRLLSQALQVARDNGCKRATLLTDDHNLAAQQFYKRHGFTPSTMLIMRLQLDQPEAFYSSAPKQNP